MNKIEKQLESLSELRQKHIDLGKKMVSADDNKIAVVQVKYTLFESHNMKMPP